MISKVQKIGLGLLLAGGVVGAGAGAVAVKETNNSQQIVKAEVTASSAMTFGNSCYIKPTYNTSDTAKFAMYFFNGTYNAWSNIMTKIDGQDTVEYQGIVPSSSDVASWTTCIAVRLNSSAAEASWAKKDNQTADITLSGTINGVDITSLNNDKCPYNTYTYSGLDRAGTYGTALCTNTAGKCGANPTITADEWASEKTNHWDVMGKDAQSNFKDATADGTTTTGISGGAARYDAIVRWRGFTNFASRVIS